MTREIPKKSAGELRELLSNVPIRGLYRHNTTNHIYEVVGKSIDCKTNEVRIHYVRIDEETSMYGDITFSRPIVDFEEPRFTKVAPYSVFLSPEEHKQYREKYT